MMYTRSSGVASCGCTMAGLAVTPLRDWFNAAWLIQLRRMLGVYAFCYVLLHFLTWLILDQDLYWAGILPDIADWQAFEGARAALKPGLSRAEPALRYTSKTST